MNLLEFIVSPHGNLHIREPGLEYYVRKSLFVPGLIELASVRMLMPCEGGSPDMFGYWKFLKRYEDTIPFMAEQVINPALEKLLLRRQWMVYRVVGGIPQMLSPLGYEVAKDSMWYQRMVQHG